MAKTFVQIGFLALILLSVIVILGMESKEPMLGMFKLGVPVIGMIMLFLALKSNFPEGLLRNKELATGGFAILILGVTYFLGDVQTPVGISLGTIGWMIAIGVQLFLIIQVLLLWEWKK